MSERLFSCLPPGPVTARPRLPLSKRLSTASCNMRFSLFTIISGASRSNKRFRRLFLLITRRYRSFRSDVANLPPSSCTMGRKSGGITGITSKIMSVGLFLLLRNASTTFRRLMAFTRFWPLPVAIISFNSSAVFSRSMSESKSRTASAPMPPRK